MAIGCASIVILLLVLFVLSPIIMLIEGSFSFYYLILSLISVFVLYVIISLPKKSNRLNNRDTEIFGKSDDNEISSENNENFTMNYDEQLLDDGGGEDWFDVLFGDYFKDDTEDDLTEDLYYD